MSRGRSHRAAAFVTFAAVLFLGSRPCRSDDATVVEGKRCVIHAPAELRASAEKCRDIVEAAIPVYEKSFAYRMPEGDRLVFRLYGDSSEYEKAMDDLGAAQLKSNWAATLAKTLESYVVVQPRSDAAYLALVHDLPEMTRFLVCHEGVHQFLRRAKAPQYDFWPAWYVEGMPDLLAEACLVASQGSPARPIVHAEDRRHRVQDALVRDRMLPLQRLLYADVTAFSDRASLYAHAYTFCRFLAADPAKLAKFHEGVRALPEPGPGTWPQREHQYGRACSNLLTKVYGPLDALEAAWVREVKTSPTPWFEDSRASEFVGEDVVCSGLPGRNAGLLSVSKERRTAPYTLALELNIADVGTKQADIFLCYEHRDAPRCVKIALGSTGFATLLAFSDGYWQEYFRSNAKVPAESLDPGAWVPVRVTVDRALIRLEVRGAQVLEAPVPPGFDAIGGAWGIGATDGAVRFRGMKEAKLAK